MSLNRGFLSLKRVKLKVITIILIINFSPTLCLANGKQDNDKQRLRLESRIDSLVNGWLQYRNWPPIETDRWGQKDEDDVKIEKIRKVFRDIVMAEEGAKDLKSKIKSTENDIESDSNDDIDSSDSESESFQHRRKLDNYEDKDCSQVPTEVRSENQVDFPSVRGQTPDSWIDLDLIVNTWQTVTSDNIQIDTGHPASSFVSILCRDPSTLTAYDENSTVVEVCSAEFSFYGLTTGMLMKNGISPENAMNQTFSYGQMVGFNESGKYYSTQTATELGQDISDVTGKRISVQITVSDTLWHNSTQHAINLDQNLYSSASNSYNIYTLLSPSAMEKRLKPLLQSFGRTPWSVQMNTAIIIFDETNVWDYYAQSAKYTSNQREGGVTLTMPYKWFTAHTAKEEFELMNPSITWSQYSSTYSSTINAQGSNQFIDSSNTGLTITLIPFAPPGKSGSESWDDYGRKQSLVKRDYDDRIVLHSLTAWTEERWIWRENFFYYSSTAEDCSEYLSREAVLGWENSYPIGNNYESGSMMSCYCPGTGGVGPFWKSTVRNTILVIWFKDYWGHKLRGGGQVVSQWNSFKPDIGIEINDGTDGNGINGVEDQYFIYGTKRDFDEIDSETTDNQEPIIDNSKHELLRMLEIVVARLERIEDYLLESPVYPGLFMDISPLFRWNCLSYGGPNDDGSVPHPGGYGYTAQQCNSNSNANLQQVGYSNETSCSRRIQNLIGSGYEGQGNAGHGRNYNISIDLSECTMVDKCCTQPTCMNNQGTADSLSQSDNLLYHSYTGGFPLSSCEPHEMLKPVSIRSQTICKDTGTGQNIPCNRNFCCEPVTCLNHNGTDDPAFHRKRTINSFQSESCGSDGQLVKDFYQKECPLGNCSTFESCCELSRCDNNNGSANLHVDFGMNSSTITNNNEEPQYVLPYPCNTGYQLNLQNLCRGGSCSTDICCEQVSCANHDGMILGIRQENGFPQENCHINAAGTEEDPKMFLKDSSILNVSYCSTGICTKSLCCEDVTCGNNNGMMLVRATTDNDDGSITSGFNLTQCESNQILKAPYQQLSQFQFDKTCPTGACTSDDCCIIPTCKTNSGVNFGGRIYNSSGYPQSECSKEGGQLIYQQQDSNTNSNLNLITDIQCDNPGLGYCKNEDCCQPIKCNNNDGITPYTLAQYGFSNTVCIAQKMQLRQSYQSSDDNNFESLNCTSTYTKQTGLCHYSDCCTFPTCNDNNGTAGEYAISGFECPTGWMRNDSQAVDGSESDSQVQDHCGSLGYCTIDLCCIKVTCLNSYTAAQCSVYNKVMISSHPSILNDIHCTSGMCSSDLCCQTANCGNSNQNGLLLLDSHPNGFPDTDCTSQNLVPAVTSDYQNGKSDLPCLDTGQGNCTVNDCCDVLCQYPQVWPGGYLNNSNITNGESDITAQSQWKYRMRKTFSSYQLVGNQCAVGYIGQPIATKCGSNNDNHADSEFSLSGCEPVVCHLPNQGDTILPQNTEWVGNCTITGQNGQHDVVQYGNTCTAQCKTGYANNQSSLIAQNQITTNICTNNGTYMEFSNQVLSNFQCDPIICRAELGPSQGTNFSGSCASTPQYPDNVPYGESCTIICKNGYRSNNPMMNSTVTDVCQTMNQVLKNTTVLYCVEDTIADTFGGESSSETIYYDSSSSSGTSDAYQGLSQSDSQYDSELVSSSTIGVSLIGDSSVSTQSYTEASSMTSMSMSATYSELTSQSLSDISQAESSSTSESIQTMIQSSSQFSASAQTPSSMTAVSSAISESDAETQSSSAEAHSSSQIDIGNNVASAISITSQSKYQIQSALAPSSIISASGTESVSAISDSDSSAQTNSYQSNSISTIGNVAIAVTSDSQQHSVSSESSNAIVHDQAIQSQSESESESSAPSQISTADSSAILMAASESSQSSPTSDLLSAQESDASSQSSESTLVVSQQASQNMNVTVTSQLSNELMATNSESQSASDGIQSVSEFESTTSFSADYSDAYASATGSASELTSQYSFETVNHTMSLSGEQQVQELQMSKSSESQYSVESQSMSSYSQATSILSSDSTQVSEAQSQMSASSESISSESSELLTKAESQQSSSSEFEIIDNSVASNETIISELSESMITVTPFTESISNDTSGALTGSDSINGESLDSSTTENLIISSASSNSISSLVSDSLAISGSTTTTTSTSTSSSTATVTTTTAVTITTSLPSITCSLPLPVANSHYDQSITTSSGRQCGHAQSNNVQKIVPGDSCHLVCDTGYYLRFSTDLDSQDSTSTMTSQSKQPYYSHNCTSSGLIQYEVVQSFESATSSSRTPITMRLPCSPNQCVCPFGYPNTGQNCPNNNDLSCMTCLPDASPSVVIDQNSQQSTQICVMNPPSYTVGHSHLQDCNGNGSPCRKGSTMGPYQCCCNQGFGGQDCSETVANLNINQNTLVEFKKLIDDTTAVNNYFSQNQNLGAIQGNYSTLPIAIQDQLFHECYYVNQKCGPGVRYPRYGCYVDGDMQADLDICINGQQQSQSNIDVTVNIPDGYTLKTVNTGTFSSPVYIQDLVPSPLSLLSDVDNNGIFSTLQSNHQTITCLVPQISSAPASCDCSLQDLLNSMPKIENQKADGSYVCQNQDGTSYSILQNSDSSNTVIQNGAICKPQCSYLTPTYSPYTALGGYQCVDGKFIGSPECIIISDVTVDTLNDDDSDNQQSNQQQSQTSQSSNTIITVDTPISVISAQTTLPMVFNQNVVNTTVISSAVTETWINTMGETLSISQGMTLSQPQQQSQIVTSVDCLRMEDNTVSTSDPSRFITVCGSICTANPIVHCQQVDGITRRSRRKRALLKFMTGKLIQKTKDSQSGKNYQKRQHRSINKRHSNRGLQSQSQQNSLPATLIHLHWAIEIPTTISSTTVSNPLHSLSQLSTNATLAFYFIQSLQQNTQNVAAKHGLQLINDAMISLEINTVIDLVNGVRVENRMKTLQLSLDEYIKSDGGMKVENLQNDIAANNQNLNNDTIIDEQSNTTIPNNVINIEETPSDDGLIAAAAVAYIIIGIQIILLVICILHFSNKLPGRISQKVEQSREIMVEKLSKSPKKLQQQSKQLPTLLEDKTSDEKYKRKKGSDNEDLGNVGGDDNDDYDVNDKDKNKESDPDADDSQKLPVDLIPQNLDHTDTSSPTKTVTGLNSDLTNVTEFTQSTSLRAEATVSVADYSSPGANTEIPSENGIQTISKSKISENRLDSKEKQLSPLKQSRKLVLKRKPKKSIQVELFSDSSPEGTSPVMANANVGAMAQELSKPLEQLKMDEVGPPLPVPEIQMPPPFNDNSDSEEMIENNALLELRRRSLESEISQIKVINNNSDAQENKFSLNNVNTFPDIQNYPQTPKKDEISDQIERQEPNIDIAIPLKPNRPFRRPSVER